MTIGPVLRLGLTGGIGSGKSTVARLFQERGATVIDADAISRACTQADGSAMPEIAQVFGPEFLAEDGSLNRERMRQHVFAHPSARRALESIIHPLVDAEVCRQAASSTSSCLVFDVPLLAESPHWRTRLDLILVVDCSKETQIQRVSQRNGWESSVTEAVISSQSPRAERLRVSDIVLFNEHEGIEVLELQVGELADRFGL